MKKFLYTAAVCLLAACRFPGASYGAQEQQTGEADAGIPAFPLWTGNANAANEESETESETETETEEIEPETEHHAIDRELLRQTLLVMRLKYGPEFTFAMRLPQESEELEESPRSEETETLETETEIPEEAAAPLIPRLTLKDAREMRDYPLPPLPTNIRDLEEKVTALTDSYSGSWSVYVKNLTTGDSFIVNDAPMKSASVMKLFIMASVYDAIDHQELERTSELVDRLSNMISYSSNEAANRLLILLGKGDLSAGVNYVNHYIQKHGYSDMTHEYNGFQDASLILDSVHFNQISAADCGLLLERVYHRDFSSRKVCNEIEDMMLKQQTRYKIPKGVPDGVLVGNKTGEMDIVENDVAVVYAHINTLHILASKILVKIVSHGVIAVDFIAVPLAVRTHINVRVLVCRCDVGDATEADILRLAADHLRGDRLTVLPVTADVRRIALRVLPRAAAADRSVMHRAAEAAGHDDLGAVQRSIELFELFDKLIGKERVVRLAAFATELRHIEVRRELGSVVKRIGFDHITFLSANNRRLWLDKSGIIML